MALTGTKMTKKKGLMEEELVDTNTEETAKVEDEVLEENKEKEDKVDTNEKVSHEDDDIQDIDLSVTRKKRFRIDGDNNRILEIDISDMNILRRLDAINPKLIKLAEEAAVLMQEDDDTEDADAVIKKTANALEKIDTEMRNLIDELFDANVSEVCAPSGSMYDPFHGQFRYEHILNIISSLYEDNLSKEFKAMSKKVSKHTNKYVKK